MVSDRKVLFVVIVAALGYFVDVFDLLLFGSVRVQSLLDLGTPADHVMTVGAHIQNMQMGGMLLGGLLWGVLGDKRGRVSVLFGSILLYSLASLANAFIHDPESYAWLRFVTGIGLAGELGAGVTLVAEMMTRQARGFGTTVIAATGIGGAVAASLMAEHLPWRQCYLIGGAMGLVLLFLRVGTLESGMFQRLQQHRSAPGSWRLLVRDPARLWRYVAVIMIGVPIWYVVGILVIFSPELGKAMGMSPAPTAPHAIRYCYIGLVLGDLASGLLSQRLKSRKQAVAIFLAATMLTLIGYFAVAATSLRMYYTFCGLLGFGAGYWAVFITTAAEQFGTNIRATVATTAPNVVRGTVALISPVFISLTAPLGVRGAAIAVGLAVFSLALLCLWGLDETYGKDLDYLET